MGKYKKLYGTLLLGLIAIIILLTAVFPIAEVSKRVTKKKLSTH